MKIKKTNDKRGDFTFPIGNFSFIINNIPAWAPRVCPSNYDFWLPLMYLHTFLAYFAYPPPKKNPHTWKQR